MDHSKMDHSSMSHDMVGGNDGAMCNMKMIFNWDIENVCIVFEWWRVTNVAQLLISCFIVMGLGIGYEFLRIVSRRYDSYNQLQRIRRASDIQVTPGNEYVNRDRDVDIEEATELIESEPNSHLQVVNAVPKNIRIQIIPSFLYALQVFYSFLLMLVFMTYNGYLMLSVAIGAGLGHFVVGMWDPLPSSRDVACH